MGTYKKDLHLGRRVPQWGTDDIADKAITEEKLSDHVRAKLNGITPGSGTYVGYMIYVDSDCGGFVKQGQTVHYKFSVWDAFAHEIDKTQYKVTWNITRRTSSFSSADLDPWNFSNKARLFDGEIDIKWSANEEDNDLDPNDQVDSTEFVVTANITELSSNSSTTLRTSLNI